MKNNYILPTKDLLEKNSYSTDSKYYNLSKILLKKDLGDKLTVPIGISEDKKKYYINLSKISGLFVAGETGSGKSIFLDSIIVTLLMKNTPRDLRFLLIDSKKIELFEFSEIPHLMDKVTNDPKTAVDLIKDLVKMMNDRRKMLQNDGYKNIENYNDKNDDKMSHIMVVIDESTDIMFYKKTKDLLEKILLDGEKLGIHLIIATNAYVKRDFDKDLLNMFDYVMSFDLATKDQAKFMNLKNADLLTVTGEALVRTKRDISKIQAPYVSLEEVNEVVNFIKNQNK